MPSPNREPLVLVAGGETDPNVRLLLRRLSERGVRSFAAQVGPGMHPVVTWDLERDVLTLDGTEVRPTAAFYRYDIFAYKHDPRPAVHARADAWFHTLAGWIRAHGEVRMMNRTARLEVNKPNILCQARDAGLEIPRTWVTNDVPAVTAHAAREPLISKPVQGGDYCATAEGMLERAAALGPIAPPTIVQNRLEQPEVRVYRVGDAYLAFSMVSDKLDYRVDGGTKVIPIPLDQVQPGIVEGLARLMDRLEMDFGAADFKTDPQTGRLLFLELNTSPMFAVFDRATLGAVCDALIDALAGPTAARTAAAPALAAA
jgi:hypothetical protein